MFFEVTIAVSYSANDRPHTTRHPFRAEACAHAFIERRLREMTEQRPGWKVLSDVVRATDHGINRTAVVAKRNEVMATLRLETRRFEDDFEMSLTRTADVPAEAETVFEDTRHEIYEPENPYTTRQPPTNEFVGLSQGQRTGDKSPG